MTADLSSQSDLITQLRSRVEVMAKRAAQQRDGLKAERDQVAMERDGLKAERDQVVKALLHVFPYDFYCEARPDLADMPNEERAFHFVRHGIHEGVSLECSRLYKCLKATHDDECKALVAKLNELESHVSNYSTRLSVVQDLFVRLSIEKRDP